MNPVAFLQSLEQLCWGPSTKVIITMILRWKTLTPKQKFLYNQWPRRLCKGSHQVCCQSPSAWQNSHKEGVRKTFSLWPSLRSLRSVQGCPGLSYHHVPKFHNPATTTSSRKKWHNYIQCFPPSPQNKTRPLHEISSFALMKKKKKGSKSPKSPSSCLKSST